MTVLLTGGAGFIGSHLADRLLAMGQTVHILDNFYHNYNPEQKRRNVRSSLCHTAYHLHEGDIRDTAMLRALFYKHSFDIVVHLAAIPGVQPSFQQCDEYMDVNVTGTYNLLESMRQFGVKRLVFGSSSSVYGETAPLPLREDYTSVQPISPYAQSKHQAEKLCLQYHNYGIETACLRFFTVYGPRQRPDMAIPLFLKSLLYNHPITIYGEGSSRDYTYVSDIVEGICNAIQHHKGFDVYNIGSGKPISIRKLIKTMEAITGRQTLVLQGQNRRGDVTHTWSDLTKSRKELMYQPTMTIWEGLTKTMTYLKEYTDSLDSIASMNF